jgi:Concanavalin A-like lectin/glucanases superfamily
VRHRWQCEILMAALLLIAVRASSATESLVITFDNPDQPFADTSGMGHLLVPGTVKEFNIHGRGVQWSNAAPQSPAGGGYGVFDGGSFLSTASSSDLVFQAGEDFTIRFWFRSSGVDRGARAGKYRTRMHLFGIGLSLHDNLEVNVDDTDSGGRGLWTYWRGGGNPFIWTPPGTVGQFTNGQWYHYWIVRKRGLLSLYVGDSQRKYTLIGQGVEAARLGSPDAPIYIGRISHSSSGSGGITLCWLGALDDLRVTKGALHPIDSDRDGVLDHDDTCPDTVLPEATVPAAELRPNHYADTDGDGVFNSGGSHKKASPQSYRLADTGGCSCEQIIVALQLGQGHRKHGCSSEAIARWIASIQDP